MTRQQNRELKNGWNTSMLDIDEALCSLQTSWKGLHQREYKENKSLQKKKNRKTIHTV